MGGYMVVSIWPTIWYQSLTLLQQYCVNQSNAIKILQSLREANPELAAKLQHLRENDPSVRSLDLSSYLLIPMQRLTRYPLLIRQILNYTEPSIDRDKIENSLIAAETILEAINESIREQEGQERLAELSKGLWVGQGTSGPDGSHKVYGTQETTQGRAISQGEEWKTIEGGIVHGYLDPGRGSEQDRIHNPMPLSDVVIHELPGGRGRSLVFPV
jgi:hypothetical protein